MKLSGIAWANALALLLPAALMAGALGSQYLGGLYPCEMCQWQRWPHYAAIATAIIAFFVRAVPLRTALIALAALAILISGGIGIWHAGVEYRWWDGITTCTKPAGGTLADIMHAPLIRCDTAQWSVFGISLAGFNALFSSAGGIAILAMLRRAR